MLWRCSTFELDQIDDLSSAVDNYQEALDVFHTRRSEHRDRHTDLAKALLLRDNKLEQMDDLDSAVDHYQEGLGLCPTGHPDRFGVLSDLAYALMTRYQQTEQIDDLNSVVNHSQEALSLRPVGHPNRPGNLCSLADALKADMKPLIKWMTLNWLLTTIRRRLVFALQTILTAPIISPTSPKAFCFDMNGLTLRITSRIKYSIHVLHVRVRDPVR
jgi:hypothetical protein